MIRLPKLNTYNRMIIDRLAAGDATSTALADHIGLDRTEITVPIGKLRRAGFIERVADEPANGAARAVYTLSSQAREAVLAMSQAAAA